MSSKPLRVAAILDEYTVVLNKGSADGITIDDKFLVYGVGDEIKDPDTGESLGKVELIRGRVKVQHLQDRLSIAKSVESVRIPGRKRTVRRSGTLAIALGSGVEEIEEDHSFEDKPLDDVAEGDFARPY